MCALAFAYVVTKRSRGGPPSWGLTPPVIVARRIVLASWSVVRVSLGWVTKRSRGGLRKESTPPLALYSVVARIAAARVCAIVAPVPPVASWSRGGLPKGELTPPSFTRVRVTVARIVSACIVLYRTVTVRSRSVLPKRELTLPKEKEERIS